jgi:SAM-dependent methyltransferase
MSDDRQGEPVTTLEYDRHADEWQRCLNEDERRAVAATWLRDDTVDAWRHRRVHEQILPLLTTDPSASWLTVGDGRYGSDARFLARHGVRAHATDMTSPLLEVAHQKGLLEAFSLENAEELSFDDGAFDYVYCKESVHHFPRPWLAVHEMFRVARRAVVLQEPADRALAFPRGPLRSVKNKIRVALGRPARQDQHEFEAVGNYVFRLSAHECEKFLLGMHHRWIATTGLNDYFERGVEFCPLTGGTAEQQALRRRVMGRIAQKDRLCRWGLASPTLLSVVLFKGAPVGAARAQLRREGWAVRELPKNPHR